MKMNEEKTEVIRILRKPSPIQIMIDQKQLKKVKYFNYLGSMTTNDARCTHEIKSRIAKAKSAFKREKSSFHQQIGLLLSTALYWIFQKVDQKYLERFEMWCLRKRSVGPIV
jgi:hypothetical protein